MKIEHETTFMSSGDNNACALEFTDALKARGLNPTVVLDRPDGSAQVLYSATKEEFAPLVAVMTAIEEKHPKSKAESKKPEKSSK